MMTASLADLRQYSEQCDRATARVFTRYARLAAAVAARPRVTSLPARDEPPWRAYLRGVDRDEMVLRGVERALRRARRERDVARSILRLREFPN